MVTTLIKKEDSSEMFCQYKSGCRTLNADICDILLNSCRTFQPQNILPWTFQPWFLQPWTCQPWIYGLKHSSLKCSATYFEGQDISTPRWLKSSRLKSSWLNTSWMESSWLKSSWLKSSRLKRSGMEISYLKSLEMKISQFKSSCMVKKLMVVEFTV